MQVFSRIFCLLTGSLIMTAASESLPLHVATGFLDGSGPGEYWAMAASYRAAFSPSGIALSRYGRQASISFPDASLHWEAEGSTAATVNFLGPIHRKLAAHAILRARDAFPGVDIVVRLREGRLKSEFQIAAGKSASRATYCLDGAVARPAADGKSLQIDAGEGWEWTEKELEAWQTRPDGSRITVSAAFQVQERCVGFRLGDLDPSLPLTVDPELVFSSYLGGGMFDAVTAVATDASGNMYLGGWTESSDFPVNAAFQGASTGRIDGFIAKVNASGQLIYSTFLGGTGEDRVQAIAINSSGLVAASGFTNSTDFPTLSPARGALSGGRDAFVTLLNAAGNQLVFSTYLGGTAHDAAWGTAFDTGGNIVVVGETASSNFPTQLAYSATAGGGVDGFISRFSAAGALLSSSYFGGGSDDRIRAVAVGSNGILHVTGSTSSSNFPIVSAPFSSIRGSMDAFYARFNSTANGLALSTYLGGSAGTSLAEEAGYGIAVDSQGRAWIAGVTPSTDFPGAAGGAQSSYGGGTSDGFVSVFTFAGSLEWSTYLGGTGIDGASAISAGAGFVGVTGYTTSTNFPVSGAVQSARAGEYDAFWAVYSLVSATPLYVSYLGGSGSDSGLAVAAAGSVLVVGGSTLSSNFPLASPIQSGNPGSYGGFVSRFRFGPGPITVTPAVAAGSSQTLTFTISHANGSANIQNAAFLINASNSFSAGCYLYYERSSNLLSLFKDAGSTWMGILPGSQTAVTNGLCTISGTGLTVTSTADSLTIAIPVTLAGSFTGAKQVYGNAGDAAGLGAGWPQVGTWNVTPAAAPAVVGVSPDSGNGLSQTFTFTFSDANGGTDIATASMLFNSDLVTTNACYFTWNRLANTISLYRDADGANLPITPGNAATVENANCSITGLGASVTITGTQASISIPVTFKSTFNGVRRVFATAFDAGDLTSSWKEVGSWSPAPTYQPTVVSSAPATGGGGSQTFVITLADGNGYDDIADAGFLWHTSVTNANGCFILYNRASNTFRLFRDSDSTFLFITPGTNTTVENANCSLSGTALAVSGNGTQLVFSLPITFKSAFTGTKNIYAMATDRGVLGSGWQIIGSWNPFPSYAPTVTGVTPASGTGASQTFTFQYADANGNADIASVAILINTTLNSATGCYLSYSRASNTLALFTAATSTWASLSPGANAVMENTNCAIAGSVFSVAASGNSFSLTVPITFKGPMFGALSVFTLATDQSGLSSGWTSPGAWIASAPAAPTITSLSPNSGSGASQIFTATVSDQNGNSDIAFVLFLVNNAVTTTNGCYLRYVHVSNVVSLYRESDATWLDLTPGSPTTATNGICTLAASGVTVTGSGSNLAIAFPLTFGGSFGGTKSLYLNATDVGGLTSGWITAGSWSLATPAAPTVTSVTPSSGSGATQSFVLTLNDANGSGDIAITHFLVNASIALTNSCYVVYSRAANQFQLYRESDASWLAVTPGTAVTVSNANCSITGTGLSASGSGTALTVTMNIVFTGGFTGAKGLYAAVTDTGGLTSGWVSIGSWSPGMTVPPTAPAFTSLTPSSGSGPAQTFSAVYTDANGFADIGAILFLMNNGLFGTNGCYISYIRSSNVFTLYRDADASWQPITPGSSGSVGNANCALSGTGLSVSGSGNTLTLTLPFSFSSAFNGAKTVYTHVTDNSGLNSGWATAGAWTPGAAIPPTAPTFTSLNPTSGSGPSRTFTAVYTDTNGGTDIGTVLFLMNSGLFGTNGCYISYTRSSNVFTLYRDADASWQPITPGSSSSVSNANCTLSGAGLGSAVSGNTLTLTLPLTFTSLFNGAKTIYTYVNDNSGLNSGWATAGGWTPGAAVPPLRLSSPL
ncbi:MAG TPA: hypothetical protein VFQ91_06705 [Bryobacteraceae bacterium]|nr:hypothetical protein [Bryobacteraceae bacterium]